MSSRCHHHITHHPRFFKAKRRPTNAYAGKQTCLGLVATPLPSGALSPAHTNSRGRPRAATARAAGCRFWNGLRGNRAPLRALHGPPCGGLCLGHLDNAESADSCSQDDTASRRPRAQRSRLGSQEGGAFPVTQSQERALLGPQPLGPPLLPSLASWEMRVLTGQSRVLALVSDRTCEGSKPTSHECRGQEEAAF